MQLTGTHVLNASSAKLWSMLLDPKVLAKITPAISRLEANGIDSFIAMADVKIGPVKGTFSGDLKIKDKIEPESFTLLVHQKSKIGEVVATVKMHLKPINDNQTEVNFDGDAQLSGLVARTGQRVLSGVANMLTKQFFEALEQELK